LLRLHHGQLVLLLLLLLLALKPCLQQQHHQSSKLQAANCQQQQQQQTLCGAWRCPREHKHLAPLLLLLLPQPLSLLYRCCRGLAQACSGCICVCPSAAASVVVCWGPALLGCHQLSHRYAAG
jgi:hypothetical protein